MTTITLVWIGDLDQDKHKLGNYPNISDERYRPKKISMSTSHREIKIGRINSKNPPDYPIESCINSRMISRNHATIERLSKGGFMLYDHSMNGTYVNYTRVTGGVTLNQGDIICFGHLNGANLKPGESVSPFFSDLKYKVEIGSSSESVKRKRRPSQHGSVATSDDDESDVSEDSQLSKKNRGSPKKPKKYDAESLNGGKLLSKKANQSRKTTSSSTKIKKGKDVEGAAVSEEVEKCSADYCQQPKGLSVDWIQCDKCNKWYHQYCVHCTKEEADADVYLCFRCKKKHGY